MRIQGLGTPAPRQPEPPANRTTEPKTKGRARPTQGATAKGRAARKAPAQKHARATHKAAKKREANPPRDGSKTAQVLTMLRRKSGATLSEIMPYASHCTSLAR
jgi:hypothetical protein